MKYTKSEVKQLIAKILKKANKEESCDELVHDWFCSNYEKEIDKGN